MCDFCVLVSSCDKYSDLWFNHFKLFFANWNGEKPKIYLLTDKKTDFSFDGVDILTIEEPDFPTRLHLAAQTIEYDYIFVTLDDYYLIDETDSKFFDYFIQKCRLEEIDYLSVYNRKFTKKNYYTSHEKLSKIDFNYPYNVNLYPAIWQRKFLENSTFFVGSPWAFEPNLTFIARDLNANCYCNISGVYNILDVVRKGKILNKAYKYFKKNNLQIPNRKRASKWMEAKETVANFLSWKLPRPIYRFIRKVAIFLGMKSYSEDAYKKDTKK